MSTRRKCIMLLEYSCENFRSIKDRITFSFLASSDDTYENQLRKFDDDRIRVLRLISLYGANGSGKTSLVQSITFLKLLVSNSINYQPGDKINRIPHKLSQKDAPTVFSCQFIKNDVRYAYGVSYVDEKITEEYLYHFRNGRQSKIFERGVYLSSLTFGDKYKKDSENAIGVLKDNRLFLSCAANFSSNQDYEAVFLFFKDDIVVYPSIPNQWLNYSIEALSSNAALKQEFTNIMKHIGTGIQDVTTKFERKRMEVNELPADMPDQLKTFIASQDASQIEAMLNYGKFSIDLIDDSSGIIKLFEVLCPLIDIIMRDKVLIWDELESSLHPCIVEDILDLFLKGKSDSNSQLLFTTHDINLLDLKRFRRDQIWFTELNPTDRSTDLFSLSELKNVRKDENIRKGYISGKYGAIPCLNGDIVYIPFTNCHLTGEIRPPSRPNKTILADVKATC